MAFEYSVIAKPSAWKQIDKLEDEARISVIERMAELRDDPYPPDSLLLDYNRQRYRVYAHRSLFRMIYHVSEKQKRVLVLWVGPRDEAYRGMGERKQSKRQE